MPSTTPNFGLIKPFDAEPQEIQDFRNNFDIIDTEIKRAQTGTWVSFTPTLTGVTVGDGTITAQKCKKDNYLQLKVMLVLGSTSAITGSVGLTLPDAPSADAVLLGTVLSRDQSAGGYVSGLAFNLTPGATGVSIFSAILGNTNPNQLAVNANNPFTWAVNDNLAIDLGYKVD